MITGTIRAGIRGSLDSRDSSTDIPTDNSAQAAAEAFQAGTRHIDPAR
jgi:hypothetical protein